MDGRSKRKSKVTPFLKKIDRERKQNRESLIQLAKKIKLEGFEKVVWEEDEWLITGGRLLKHTGKQMKSTSLFFQYPPKLGSGTLERESADLIKALLVLRFHRSHQAVTNQRSFITAVCYVAYFCSEEKRDISNHNEEILDKACLRISEDYREGTAYNLHKAIGEFSAYCDVNRLCKVRLEYKYSRMKRPASTGGMTGKRLDDPESSKTESEKVVNPVVYKAIGALFRNVPEDHKYRIYIVILALLACTGRRFSEITLAPNKSIQVDKEGKVFFFYFPRKASKGDVFTPLRECYLISKTVDIVQQAFDELGILTCDERESAEYIFENESSDTRFLEEFDEGYRFYKEDLEKLGLNPQLLSGNAWIKKNGETFPDEDRLTSQGRKPANPILFTNKSSVLRYCQKDYKTSINSIIHTDQHGKDYYLKDLLCVKYMGLSTGAYSHWMVSQITHSMMTTFLRYLDDLVDEYLDFEVDLNFKTHDFRHTLNTLLDEGGLPELIQTEWFGRSNPKDTKSYQHTPPEKKALILREAILSGRARGALPDALKKMPISQQEAIVNARVKVALDVGPGQCIHHHAQIPCERHLQCSAECDDLVWIEDEPSERVKEQKRQYSMTVIARDKVKSLAESEAPLKSGEWLIHNQRKLDTLEKAMETSGVVDFDPHEFLREYEQDE